MAGNWIKLRTDLHGDPSVIRLGQILQLDTFAVVGRLAAVWVWADSHANRHGVVTLVSRSCLDSVTQCAGFGDALQEVGWLKTLDQDAGIMFPNFDRHMGEGAKQRINALLRQQKRRATLSRSCHAHVTKTSRQKRDKSVTTEQRREEKSRDKTPLPPTLDTPRFRDAFQAWKDHRAAKKKPATQQAEAMALKKLEAMGEARAVAAIEHSVANGWDGIFEPKPGDNGKPFTTRGQAELDFAARMAQDAFAGGTP